MKSITLYWFDMYEHILPLKSQHEYSIKNQS